MKESEEEIQHRLSQQSLSLIVQACPGMKSIGTCRHQNTFWTEGGHCFGIRNILGCMRLHRTYKGVSRGRKKGGGEIMEV